MENVMLPEESPELKALYEGFEKENIKPLWTQLGDLMPVHPKSKAVPYVWKWSKLNELAEKSGELIPVGRAGERRALGLANPRPRAQCLYQPDALGRDPAPRPA